MARKQKFEEYAIMRNIYSFLAMLMLEVFTQTNAAETDG